MIVQVFRSTYNKMRPEWPAKDGQPASQFDQLLALSDSSDITIQNTDIFFPKTKWKEAMK